MLLSGLTENNVGSLAARWRCYASIQWSNFDNDTYEAAISDIRAAVPEGHGLWTIEQFWKGHQ